MQIAKRPNTGQGTRSIDNTRNDAQYLKCA